MISPSPLTAEQYTQLVEAVVRAVPEIEDGESHCPKCGGHTRTQADPDCRFCIECDEDDAYKIVAWNDHFPNRPITLEDILMAMLTPDARADDTDYCQMCGQGNLDHMIFTLVRDKWTLGKPLSDQPPETKLFLFNLLV